MKTNEDFANPTVMLKRMLYWRMAFFSVIILLAGMAIGASGMFMWLSSQKPKSISSQTMTVNRVMRQLNSQLKLSKPQADQIRPMLRKCVDSLEQVRKQARPQINQHLKHMNQGIAAVLKANQMKQWKKYEKQLMGLLQENRVRQPVPAKPKPAQTQRQTSQKKPSEIPIQPEPTE
ncbi:MAG: hypothetical protein K9N55_09425 [Phycisphaerae bacterium]|nr:hypothetical protein [Phycisphaerae bacterium]